MDLIRDLLLTLSQMTLWHLHIVHPVSFHFIHQVLVGDLLSRHILLLVTLASRQFTTLSADNTELAQWSMCCHVSELCRVIVSMVRLRVRASASIVDLRVLFTATGYTALSVLVMTCICWHLGVELASTIIIDIATPLLLSALATDE